MREELKDFNFKEYVELKYKTLTFKFERKENTFIAGVIDLKKLCDKIGMTNVKCVRRTVLFAKERFCEIAIIDLGENYLVEAAKFKHPRFRFGNDLIEEDFFHNIYITTEMRFFLIDKKDNYIKFLLQKLSSECKNFIAELVDLCIEEMLLSNEVTGYKKYVFQNSVILKHLFDTDLQRIILCPGNPGYYSIDKCYRNLPIKVTSEGDFKKVEFNTNDMIQENEKYYTKVDILNEKLTIIKIKNPTPWSIFKGTIIEYLYPVFSFENIILPSGTDIYIKNFEKDVVISFYDDEHIEEDLVISVSMITGTKMIICQPIKTEDSFPLCFNEREVIFPNYFLVGRLINILTWELRSYIDDNDVGHMNIFKSITGKS